jgi:hypothetical protein
MLRLHTLLLATAVVGAAGSVARADEMGASVSGSTASASDTDRFTLPKGKLLLDAFVEMNLSKDQAFKPVSISPDLWYGVNDDVTIGLVHSGIGATGFLEANGNSLCITGSSNGCGHVYNNVGLDGRIRIAKPWAVDVGLYITSISDPFQLAAKLGIDGRWTWNKLALELQPSFFLGLTNREPMSTGMVVIATNTETLYVPATLSYLVAPKLDLALQAGLVLPFTKTSDTWAIPLAIAARYAVSPKFGLGLAFTFPDLIGGTSSADARTLLLGGSYAF